MYIVEVIRDNKIIRTRHFKTKKQAEDYENNQYKHNPIASYCEFKIAKIEG